MVQIGCCAFNYRGLDLPAAFRLVRQCGFERVSVGADSAESQVDQEELIRQPEKTGRWIAEQARQCGLYLQELFVCRVMVNGVCVDTNTADAALRKRLLLNLERISACAATAGFANVMGVPGSLQSHVGHDRSWQLAVEMLTAMVDTARAAGSAFTVEPHKGSLLEQPAAALAMANAVPGLRYTLDYTHFVSRRVPVDEVFPLHRHAVHMHARQTTPGLLKCPFREGEVPYDRIIERLAVDRWEGTISAEYIGDIGERNADRNPVVQNALMAHELCRLLKRPA